MIFQPIMLTITKPDQTSFHCQATISSSRLSLLLKSEAWSTLTKELKKWTTGEKLSKLKLKTKSITLKRWSVLSLWECSKPIKSASILICLGDTVSPFKRLGSESLINSLQALANLSGRRGIAGWALSQRAGKPSIHQLSLYPGQINTCLYSLFLGRLAFGSVGGLTIQSKGTSKTSCPYSSTNRRFCWSKSSRLGGIWKKIS